jgi:hypothetical protein
MLSSTYSFSTSLSDHVESHFPAPPEKASTETFWGLVLVSATRSPEHPEFGALMKKMQWFRRMQGLDNSLERTSNTPTIRLALVAGRS